MLSVSQAPPVLYPQPTPPAAADPPKQANGVFAFGVYVGGGLSSLSIALAKWVGWRGSAYTVAGYGLLLSLLVRFTVREPVRTPAAIPVASATQEEGGRGAGKDDEEREKDYTVTERYASAGFCKGSDGILVDV